MPIAPESCPTTDSPIVNSSIVAEALVIDCRVRVGDDGLDVSADSKIP